MTDMFVMQRNRLLDFIRNPTRDILQRNPHQFVVPVKVKPYVSRADVCACDEAEEVPLYWELLLRPQSGGAGRLDVHEEQ